MRKIIILIILVIVLLSIQWFQAQAIDVSTLSPEQISELLQKHRAGTNINQKPGSYKSPQIFSNDKSSTKTIDTARILRSIQESSSKSKKHSDSITNSTTTSSPSKRFPSFSELRPFGMELFQGLQDMSPPVDIASADDYILGPGDNVIIYLWGRVEQEYNVTLDREGKVILPRVGDIVAWGLSLEQFKDRLRKRLSKVYSDFELTVSLGKIRSIRIYITGEVAQPGAYTVTSLTSVLNAIFTAGGPTERGSMRNIRVMRAGKPAATIDLYDLLLKGDNSNDFRLQTGDAIFVPVTGAQVAIRGEIKRSAIYELKGGETVKELLALAGNTTPEAYLERIMLERIGSNGEWEVRDLNLSCSNDTSCDDIPLCDGDQITVYSIFQARTNIVAIFGKVKHPGYYERNDTTRVSDLFERGQLQPYDVYYQRVDLFRRYPDHRVEVIPINLKAVMDGDEKANILLADRDSLYVYAINQVERDKHVYIEGEVERPGRYPLYDKMTVADLIFLAGSFLRGANDQHAEIARIDSLGNVGLINLNLDDSLQLALKLREDDHLYIRKIPEWELDRSITVAGEVTYPGKYWLASRHETLYELLQRCGGFTANAFPRGIVLERKSIENNLNRLNVDDLLKRSQPIIMDSTGNMIQAQLFDYESQSVNRIIIDIDRIMGKNGKQEDITLEPGDRIYVPSKPSGISVIGAVGANGTIKYQPNLNVKAYIKRAGNFTRRADKKGIRLVHAWGEVISGGDVLKKKVEMGDVIVVPAKIQRERNWLKTISTALTATTSVLTTVYLVSRL